MSITRGEVFGPGFVPSAPSEAAAASGGELTPSHREPMWILVGGIVLLAVVGIVMELFGEDSD